MTNGYDDQSQQEEEPMVVPSEGVVVELPAGKRERLWDPGDPLIPELAVFLNLEYLLKTAPTLARLFLLYGEGDLASVHALAQTSNLSLRILLPVKVRDTFVKQHVPEQYRYLTLLRREDDPNRLPGEVTFDVTKPGEIDPLPDGKQLTCVPARFFKLSGTKMEGYGRNDQGFYTMSAADVEGRWRTNLEAMGVGRIIGADYDSLSADDQREASDRALVALHLAREEIAPRYYDHEWYWALRQRVEKGEDRSLSFNSMERWNHRLHVQALIERLPPDGQRGPYRDTQTIRDSIDVLLDLEKLGATILERPILRYITETDKDGVEHDRVIFIYQGEFATLGTYQIRHMEKTVTWRKTFMSFNGATVLALVKEDDPRLLRDRWYFGSVPDLPLSHYILLRGDVDRRFYQGKLANVPETFQVPDFPRLAGFFFKLGVKVPLSYQCLEDTIHRIHNGDVIFRDDQWKKYRFINWDEKQIFWAYVETNGQGVMTPAQYEAAGSPAGWELHAVARNTWATYLNLLWVIRYETWLFPQLAEHINNLAEEEELPVRITYDGSDCNFFKTRETWLAIWRAQPLKNIRERVMKEIVEPLVEAGKWLDLRGELVKFFTGLPTWQDHREDITDLFEDFLEFADSTVLSHQVWLTIDGYARNVDASDVKRSLADGLGIFPTERMANRHPDIKWGRRDRPAEQYSPFTFKGQQKRRLDFAFIAYDANFVVTRIRALVDKIAFGVQPTVDDVYDDIMSNLGTRGFYPKRILNALDFIEKFVLRPVGKHWGITIPTSLDGKSTEVGGLATAKKAFELMRQAVVRALENWDETQSHKVDLAGAMFLRNRIGEKKGKGGWVDAVQEGRLIEEIRSRLPGA